MLKDIDRDDLVQRLIYLVIVLFTSHDYCVIVLWWATR